MSGQKIATMIKVLDEEIKCAKAGTRIFGTENWTTTDELAWLRDIAKLIQSGQIK